MAGTDVRNGRPVPRSHKAFMIRRRSTAVNRRYVVGGVVVATVVCLSWAVSPAAALSILGWLAADPIRYAVALVGLAAVRPFLAWPTTLLAVTAGYGYGWAGLPFAVLLMTATAVAPYSLARLGRVDHTDGSGAIARIGRAGDRLVGATGSVRAVSATRFLPVPADAVSVTAGVSGVRPRPFLLGTAIGESPWAAAGVALGVSAGRLARTGLSAADPALLVAAGLAGCLLLAGPLYRIVSGDRSGSQTA